MPSCTHTYSIRVLPADFRKRSWPIARPSSIIPTTTLPGGGSLFERLTGVGKGLGGVASAYGLRAGGADRAIGFPKGATFLKTSSLRLKNSFFTSAVMY